VGYDHNELNGTVTNDLNNLLAHLEAEPSLFEPEQLRKRLEILDALDAHFENVDEESHLAAIDHTRILARANLLHDKLESANAVIYNAIRDQVLQGASPSRLRQWIERCSDNGKTQPGLGYDHLDEMISGILQASEPEIEPLPHLPEMVFYQPTPARHILQLIRLSALSASDTLIDLGSGLGHVPILASILTGAQCIGIEAEQAYVASARECAQSLHLKRVAFVHQNATEANLAGGTVFYVYTPFIGGTLKTVLQKLQKESGERLITICTLGPCTATVAMEPWLNASSDPDPNQITCFRPTL
jgi:precorrin-6B methylase 2